MATCDCCEGSGRCDDRFHKLGFLEAGATVGVNALLGSDHCPGCGSTNHASSECAACGGKGQIISFFSAPKMRKRRRKDKKPKKERPEPVERYTPPVSYGGYDTRRTVPPYVPTRKEKVRNAWKCVPGALIGYPYLFGIIGCIVVFVPGCMIRAVAGYHDPSEPLVLALNNEGTVAAAIGFVAGLIFGIRNIVKALK